jgi:TRAP transporter TAXI family solute receptor
MKPRLGRRSFLTAGVAAAVGSSSCSRHGPRRLAIAAGDEGGIYVAFARLLAGRLEARVDRLTVDVQLTRGSVDNLRRLSGGTADLGLALADSVAGQRGGVRPLALARIYENYLQLVVREDGPVHDVRDLRGGRVVLGAAGSGAAVTGRVLLRAAGVGAADVEVSHADLAASLELLRAGAADAVLWSGGIPTPAISALDQRLALRMLDLGRWAPRMARDQGYPYAARRVPPVGYAPGPSDAATVGVPNLLLTRPGLAELTADTVVEVLADEAPRLVPEFVQGLQYLSPATMIQTGEVPLHPGAVAAYRRLHG